MGGAALVTHRSRALQRDTYVYTLYYEGSFSTCYLNN
jgi:hypothetical protein